MSNKSVFLYKVYDSLPEQFNFVDYLFSQIKSNEFSQVAFIQKGNVVTYAELFLRVKQWASLLQAFGVEQETRVAILLPDDLDFVCAFLAILWLGSVAIVINEAYSDSDIEYILKDCRAGLIVSRTHWTKKLSPELVDAMQWMLIDTAELMEKIHQQIPVNQPVKVAREAVAFWVYTSGSTGRPKGVLHSHYNPVVAIENYGKNILKLSCADVVLSAPPMAFSYGLGASIYFPIFFRATVIICSESSPFEQIKLINAHQVTVFFGIPHTYAAIYALHDILPLAPKCLRLCISAGEQLPITLWKNWREHFGISICEGIGTTESTHIFISNTIENTVPGSTGRVVPGYVVRLVDEVGKEVPEDMPGLLEVSGEGFMQGYWNQLKATHKILQGQTMMTGDFYRCDQEKNYYFIGRKDSLIKVKGMWISPVEIEEAFLQHPLVIESAVVLKPGIIEDTFDIVAYVRLKNEAKLTRPLQTEIISLLSTKLPKFKIPRRILAVSKLPRTATGKIHRSKLAEAQIE